MGDYSSTFRIHNLMTVTLKFREKTDAHGYWVSDRHPGADIAPNSISNWYQLKDNWGTNGSDGTVIYDLYTIGGRPMNVSLSIYIACPGGAPSNRAAINFNPSQNAAWASVSGYSLDGHPNVVEFTVRGDIAGSG